MITDKIWLIAFSMIAFGNAIAAAVVANPIPNGIIAGTSALLAIAWSPRA